VIRERDQHFACATGATGTTAATTATCATGATTATTATAATAATSAPGSRRYGHDVLVKRAGRCDNG
jgi:hypothetical protein